MNLDGLKTIAGICLIAAAAVAGNHGYELDMELIQKDINDILIAIGMAVAFYGRYKAKGPITFRKTKGEPKE